MSERENLENLIKSQKYFRNEVEYIFKSMRSERTVYRTVYFLDLDACICTCPGFIGHKDCKHVKYVKKNIDIESLKSEEAREISYPSIPTGVSALDEIFDGFAKRNLVGILGVPRVGKTLFSLQVAMSYFQLEENNKVLYVDTEGFSRKAFAYFVEKFQDRFQVSNYPTIVVRRDIQELFKLFGFEISFGFSESGKIEELKVEKTVSPDLSNFGLIIIDSFSAPLKSILAAETKNLSARASLQSLFLGNLQEKAERNSQTIILINHFSQAPFGISEIRPWGGDNIFFNIKYLLAILQPTKIEYSKAARLGRRFRVVRHPYRIEGNTVGAKIVEDFGFGDLD